MAACRSLFIPRFAFKTCKNILTPRNLNVFNSLQNEVSMQKLTSALNLPEKPKRPLSPFFKFMTSVRPQLTEQNRNFKPTEISKLVAVEWKKINENKKKEYQSEYENEMIGYVKNMVKYEQSLTQDQRNAIKDLKQQEKVISEKRAHRKKLKNFDKPKKPLNNFMLFMEDQQINRDPSQNYMEWRSEKVKEWHSLSDEMKKKYADRFKVLFDKYKNELNLWETEMIRRGHTEMVRSKCLVEDLKKK